MPILSDLPNLARVPEHSAFVLEGLSGGEVFECEDYIFCAGKDWLMGIGYALSGKDNSLNFWHAFKSASDQTHATRFFTIAPHLPEEIAPHIQERDRFYVLSANAQVPGRLRSPLKKAAQRLEIRESKKFTASHRQLWAEFMAKGGMSERVAELYAKTPVLMEKNNGNLLFLDAVTADGHLVASLLLDFTANNFISYIIGAHSRKNYIPHATDLLVKELLNMAKVAGKKYIHLGLGVNEGILRFKRKWGAVPSLTYEMAQWEGNLYKERQSLGRTFALALMNRGQNQGKEFSRVKAPYKPFAMLWELEKNGKKSWLGGTAHFFCHSFEFSFRKLFKKVDNVLFEGPLDEDFLGKVFEAGISDKVNLLELLTPQELQRLEKITEGPKSALARCLGLASRKNVNARELLTSATPWRAFFSLWNAYLERLGWDESVDMEAWRIAREMDKNVIGMESLEEQLESLESLPVERVIRFFRDSGKWRSKARANRSAYLAGDLERMMGSSAEFPTRTEHIVGRRDQRFLERMLPWVEKGRTAVFVGSAHLVNLRFMLAENGFTVRQTPHGIWPKLQLKWRSFRKGSEEVKW